MEFNFGIVFPSSEAYQIITPNL